MYSERNECENIVRKGKTEEDVKIQREAKINKG
jgi:hypothetical protein